MERNYKQELKEIFESVTENGIRGAIPVLICEALNESRIGNNKAAMFAALADGAKQVANKRETEFAEARKLDGRDIYIVFEDFDGVKKVKVCGFFYFDEGIRFTTFCHCVFDIPVNTENARGIENECSQYVDDYTEDAFMAEWRNMLSYYPKLPLDKVNSQTPCGTYIDM